MDGAKAIRYEVNRSLTPMAHLAFEGAPSARQVDICSRLARDLFSAGLQTGQDLRRVHMFSNVITLFFASGSAAVADFAPFEDSINKLFIHYLPGVQPTPVELETTPAGPAADLPETKD